MGNDPYLRRTAATIGRGAFMAFFVLFAFVGGVPAADAQTGEEVSAYSADITVQEDGRIVVTETIDYYFPTARHGIYRDIPTMYEDEEGRKLTVPVDVTSVVDGQGQPWRFQTNKERYGVNVKIGDPNATVTGTQRYVITYVASGAIRYFDDHDELYWNVTGFEWQVPIRRVEATVRLPGSVRGSEIRTKCFTGPKGSTEQDCLANVQANAAHFAADDFLTVVVGFPTGRVAVLKAKTGLPPWVGALLPFFLPAAAFLILFVLWWRRGRDPEGRGTIVVQYDAPDGMRPAEVGVLVDEKAHIHDITATIVDLAVRGYLKIRETEPKGFIFKKKDFEFVKTGKDAADLKDHESLVYFTLFSGSVMSRMSDLESGHAFHERLPKIKKALYAEAVRGGYFPVEPDKVRTIYAGIGIVIGVLLYIASGPVSVLLGGGFAGASWYGAAALTTLIIIGFASLMPRKTAKGTAAYEHAEGFKEYIEKAEKYRLEWQEQEKMFELLLPYAMVFEVVDKYTKAFENIDMKPPEWFEGRGGLTTFNAVAFAGTFHTFNSAMGKAITSSPQQSSSGSGFGGGGFSGGGGGGGGGGSW